MIEDTRRRFDAGAATWAEYNRKPLGRIRREVTWRNLAPHLPQLGDSGRSSRVLDVGGGSGELALRLVRCGYHVWLLDYAPAMLDQARRATRNLPAEVSARLTLCPMVADSAPQAFALGFFDVITCHTLIEYLSDPRATLRSLTAVLCAGGLLSLSFVNRYAEVQRQVWSQADPDDLLASLEDSAFCATLFDVPGSAYTAEEVSAWLNDLGMEVSATLGVRAFADYVPRERLDNADFFDALLRMEIEVASRAPFNALARYVHLIAHKTIDC